MNTNLKVLFKLTTRSRHEKAFVAINSIIDNRKDKDNFALLITLDDDDPSLTEMWKLQYESIPYKKLVLYGESKTKIKAINRDVNYIEYDWQILVNVSDDQLFIRKGFDDIIRDAFIEKSTMKPNLDMFVHFPDGNRIDLCTMSIMGRDYYERDKYIYNPIYVNEYCDNEAQDVAIIRGCYKFINEQIFEHNHPNYNRAETDELYRLNNEKGLINYDAMKYTERKINNFGL